jgi:hypothetical protein
MVEGSSQKREQVDFSNWFAANVDPEDLKRFLLSDFQIIYIDFKNINYLGTNSS